MKALLLLLLVTNAFAGNGTSTAAPEDDVPHGTSIYSTGNGSARVHTSSSGGGWGSPIVSTPVYSGSLTAKQAENYQREAQRLRQVRERREAEEQASLEAEVKVNPRAARKPDRRINTDTFTEKEAKKLQRRKAIEKEYSSSSEAPQSLFDAMDDSDPLYSEIKTTVLKLNDLTPRGREKKLAKEFGLVATREATDAYYGQDEEASHFFLEAAKTFLDVAMGVNPATSMGQDIWELFTGTSITGDRLGTGDRAVAFFGIVSGSVTGGVGSSALRSVRNINTLFKKSRHLVKDAEIIAALIREGRNSVKANLDLYRGWIKSHRIQKITDAVIVNARFEKNGFDAPYKVGTEVFDLLTTKKGDYVRVYGGKSSMKGGWIMKKDSIKGLTPKQIMDKFYLPQPPTHVVDVHIPASTELYRGRAAWVDHTHTLKKPLDAMEGSVQYNLKKFLADEHWTNARKISEL